MKSIKFRMNAKSYKLIWVNNNVSMYNSFCLTWENYGIGWRMLFKSKFYLPSVQCGTGRKRRPRRQPCRQTWPRDGWRTAWISELSVETVTHLGRIRKQLLYFSSQTSGVTHTTTLWQEVGFLRNTNKEMNQSILV